MFNGYTFRETLQFFLMIVFDFKTREISSNYEIVKKSVLNAIITRLTDFWIYVASEIYQPLTNFKKIT